MTLQTPAATGQTILLSYTAGDVQSADGENLASFINMAPGNSSHGSVNTYDAAADFSVVSNPNGVWSYGWASSLTSVLNLYPDKTEGDIEGFIDRSNNLFGAPAVFHNKTASTIQSGTVVMQPGQLLFHPGYRGEYSYVRWTAPAAGKLSATSEFTGMDVVGTTTDVHILLNGVSLFNDSVNGYGTRKSFSTTVSVIQGDIIDFAVGFGTGGLWFDSTGIAANISYALETPTNVRVIDTIPGADIVIDQSSFNKTPFSVTAEADKTMIEWRYDTFSIGQLEALAFDVTLKNPVPGENRLVNQKLEVLYDDISGNPARTELGAYYVHVLNSVFDSAVTTDKPVYQANEAVSINAAVKNLSESAKTIDAKVLIEDGNGVFVQEAAALPGLSFAAGETKNLSNIVFNTGATLAGAYRARLILYDNQAEAGGASTDFNIHPTAADPTVPTSISSKVATDKISYGANQQVVLTSAATSQSSNSLFSNLTALITVVNSEGTILFTDSRSLPILTPGQAAEIKSYWNTGVSAAGLYTIRLDILDGVTLLSASERTLQITDTSATGEGLTGTITAAPNPVDRGRDETLIYMVANNGNEDVNDLSLEILIADPDTEQTMQTLQGTINVPKNTTATGSFPASTAILSPKAYVAVLRVSSSAMAQPKTLASATFEVKESLEVTKSMPDVINLLVWVNKKCKETFERHKQESDDCWGCTDLLENILRSAATGYTIVYDKKDFQRELRNPYFTDYLIWGDHDPLEDHYDAELKEQVYAGKGLISSLYLKQGEEGDGKASPLFGVRYKGSLDGDHHKIELMESPLAGQGELDAGGKAVRVEALGDTTIAGWIRESKHKGQLPAIVLNGYGDGKTAYFAFDLGETLNDENFAQLSVIISNSIRHVHKQAAIEPFRPAQFVLAAITITSPWSAFDVRLTETYSPELKIYDPLTIQWAPDNPWITNIHIDPGQTKSVLHYILTPDKAGVYSLQSEVGYMIGGQYNLHQNFTTEIAVGKDRKTAAADIIVALNGLAASSKDKAKVKEAVKYIENVRDRAGVSVKDMEKNIDDLLKAVEKLIDITSTDVRPVRLMIANLLLSWEGQMYFSR